MKTLFDQILAEARRLTSKDEATNAIGENFVDVPADKIVLHQITLWPTEDKKVQINTTTPDALSGFEWHAEITIDDRSGSGGYSHFLLRTDNTLVETYGKNVLEVSEESAEKLLRELTTIS